MKSLTIRQPWASLIAAGVKTIETRSRRTHYRGPLAIHAAKADTDATIVPGHPAMPAWDALGECIGAAAPPRGAVVAVADLVDCVPIVGVDWEDCDLDCLVIEQERAWIDRMGVFDLTRVDDQLPYDDFTLGRWAWILDNVRPLAEPVPTKGHQGLRDVPECVAAEIKEHLAWPNRS